MWCERIIGNIADYGPHGQGGRRVEYVDLDWNQTGPALKARTRDGEEIRIVLGAGGRMRHGDIVFEDDTRVVAINVRPCEVIVARPGDQRAFAILALELGNLHAPTQIADGEIVFCEQPAALAVVEELQILYARETRRFQPTELIAGPLARLSSRYEVIRGGVAPRAASSCNSIRSA